MDGARHVLAAAAQHALLVLGQQALVEQVQRITGPAHGAHTVVSVVVHRVNRSPARQSA